MTAQHQANETPAHQGQTSGSIWRIIRAAVLAAAGTAVLVGGASVAAQQSQVASDTDFATDAANVAPATQPAANVAMQITMPTAGPTAGPAAVQPATQADNSGLVIATVASNGDITAVPAASQQTGFITESTPSEHPFQVMLNKSLLLNTATPYKTLKIGQPDIVDANLLTPTSLLLTGKKPGSTQVIIWGDDNSKAPTSLNITVTQDTAALQGQLDKLFPERHIKVDTVNDSVMLRGHVPSLNIAQQVLTIAKTYSPNVMNALEVSGGQQVCLQVRFAEVSRTASTALGINGAFSSNKFSLGNNAGQINPSELAAGQQGTAASAFSVSNAVTLYGTGYVGSTLLEGFIDALRQNDLVRILAEPNLVTVSGEEADFLAGGSFPIPVAQGGGTGAGAVITIEYRDYGVKLKFTPVVLGNGRIRLKLAPEVSELDYANGVTLNNFVVPGTDNRNLSTTVELADGQTFAVAGLLQSNISASKDVTPLLGDLPVLGALFRSVRYQNQDTELVVLVTPHLVEALNPGQVPHLPGEVWETPTEKSLFLDQYLGGDRSSKSQGSAVQPGEPAAGRAIPAFYGQVGFVAPAPAGPQAAPTADAK